MLHQPKILILCSDMTMGMGVVVHRLRKRRRCWMCLKDELRDVCVCPEPREEKNKVYRLQAVAIPL